MSLVTRAPSKSVSCEQVGSSGMKAGEQRPLAVDIRRAGSVGEDTHGLIWLVPNGV